MLTRKQLIYLNIYHIFLDGLYDAIPILLTFMVLAFAGGVEQVGIIIASAAFVSTLVGSCTAFFSQRLGFRGVLLYTIGLYGVGFLANAFAFNLIYVALFFVLAMTGHSLFHNIAFAFFAENVAKSRLGKTLSDFTAWGDIGRIPFTAVAGFIGAMVFFQYWQGWRLVCLVFGLIALVIAGLIFKYNYRRDDQLPATNKKSRRLLPQWRILQDRALFMSILSSMLAAFSCSQIFIFLPMLLLSKGVDTSVWGAFALVFTLGCFVGKMLFGRLVDKFGTLPIFICAQLIMAMMLVGLVFTNQLSLVLLLALLLGIVTKGSVPTIQVLITEPVKDKSQLHDLFSLNSMLCGIVTTIAPLLFGLISARYGIDFIYLIMAVSALMALLPIGVRGRV